MTFDELRKIAFAAAKKNGWHDGPPRYPLEIAALVHSELAEATECARDKDHAPENIWHQPDGKPEGLAVEYADVLIRCADAGEELGLEMVWEDTWQTYDLIGGIPDRLERHGYYHGEIHRIFANSSWSVPMSYIHYNLRKEILALGHDPDKIIMDKIAYNKTRGFKHNKLA